jgi:hypothetical protein
MKSIQDVYQHMRECINKGEALKTEPIIKDVTSQRTIIIHGTWFNDCEICDNEITESNPGKEITYTENSKRYMVFVCNECYREPDYLEIMTKKENLKIKNFEL